MTDGLLRVGPATKKAARMIGTAQHDRIAEHLPEELRTLGDLQTAIPALAKNPAAARSVEQAIQGIPTRHRLFRMDSRRAWPLEENSVHLVLTSPPYWTLKKYRDCEGQLGEIEDYAAFVSELDKVWKQCYRALAPGGRIVCVVGDVCLSRRKNAGRHAVAPLHAAIQEHCRQLGFDNLAPIIWNKIANARFEAEGNGAGFLGKPYEPNGVIKNDIEFILMERKPGGYRAPGLAARILSVISEENHREWFQQVWTGLTGASTKSHPAPFPLKLAERLVRMFSFVGDTVLDPFAGTGTTNLAAANWGRDSVGFEVDPHYLGLAQRRISDNAANLFRNATVAVEE